MASPNPFGPGLTQTLACTATTGRVALGGTGSQFLVCNSSTTDLAFVQAGDSTVTASVTFPTSSAPVLPGESRIFTLPDSATHVAGICLATKSATIYICRGNGG